MLKDLDSTSDKLEDRIKNKVKHILEYIEIIQDKDISN